MKTYKVRCKCGELYYVDETGIGKQLKCRRCNRVIEVRRMERPKVPLSTRVGERLGGFFRAIGRVIAMPFTKPLRLVANTGRYARSLVFDPQEMRRRQKPVARWSALTWRLSWAYLATAILIAAILWGLGDRWWVATILLFIGRWIFLLPLVVLVPAALAFRRRAVVPLLFATLVILDPVMGLRTGWRAWVPHPSGEHVRVVTFNADNGDGVASVLPMILETWDADIIAFEECGPQLTAAVQQTPGWNHHEEHGLCLLTHFPINSVNVMDRSAFERVKLDEAAGIGGSADVVRYDLQLPQGSITFAIVHLETPRKGLEGLAEGVSMFDLRRLKLNTELRDIESNVARRWVDQGRGPTLVVGDFNTPIESRIFQEHWGDLADAFSQTGVGFGMSKYNGWIRVRIDHVLMNPAWRADRVQMGNSYGSDHLPVIADLTLVDYK
jgi:endonuclease/exonuclease/phosphatase (EEP) superfamily protein YafD